MSNAPLFKEYVEAARVAKRPLTVLLVEALRLRLSCNRLGLSEYIDYQLYLSDLTYQEKTTFGSIRTQSILEEILIDDYSKFLSLDKLTMYAVLAGLKLPVPAIRALYRTGRRHPAVSLETAKELEAYLRSSGSLPVYIKRSFGAYGKGNALISKLDQNIVDFGNGTRMHIEDFCQSLDSGRTLGWILQEPISSQGR